MPYFLFKSEPAVYSFDDLLRDGETAWDGVTNPTAVKNLREMKPGTKWIFYHTSDERTAVGTGTVLSVDAADPKVPIVRVKAGKRLKPRLRVQQLPLIQRPHLARQLVRRALPSRADFSNSLAMACILASRSSRKFSTSASGIMGSLGEPNSSLP
jgi:hypothetical protein